MLGRNSYMETLLSSLWLTLLFVHWLTHKKGVGEIQCDNIAVINSLRRHTDVSSKVTCKQCHFREWN